MNVICLIKRLCKLLDLENMVYLSEGSVEVVVRIRSQQALAQAKDILLFASMGL